MSLPFTSGDGPFFPAKKGRSVFSRYWPVLFVLALIVPAFPQKTADMFIIDKPEKFTVLNRFQQPLTASEQNELVSFSPMQIVNNEEILGDQITKALRFELDGKVWFLQKDDAGKFLGASSKDGRAVLKGCVLVNDTVYVSSGSVAVSIGLMPGPSKGFLSKGEKVIRVFKYGNAWYVKRDTHPPQYCWCALGNADAFHKATVAAQEADTSVAKELESRILARFQTANDTYRQYFDHFNAVTGQSKTIPFWQCSIQNHAVSCVLNAPYRNTALLDESSRYIVRDIENLLIGKRYAVKSLHGEILIEPMAGEIR